MQNNTLDTYSGYIDGSVDVANRAILNEDGVSMLRYPKLSYAAERSGFAAINLVNTFTRHFYLRHSLSPRWLPEPVTARRVGAGVMLALSSVVAFSIVDKAESLGSAGHTASEFVQEFVSENITRPMISLSFPSYSKD